MTSITPDLQRVAAPNEAATLIDDLLAEQRSLTAVERFSRAHDHHGLPANQKSYHQLLPATAPGPGQQYAFEVNLDQCSGCKACVTACHSLNGLDDIETWRSVGLLVTAQEIETAKPYQQHVTTACHHCADPGCANGCPVLAYDKDPVTGIVRHLDDQCMGCSYCVMKCPYEVPIYSSRLGIVRKCDMCSQRLAVGEAPACVQACPNEAIKITVVETPKLTERRSGTRDFLPDAPDARITLPTTRFLSTKLPADLVAADHAAPRLDHAHWPLVIMLTLTQAAAGTFVAAALASVAGNSITVLAMTGFASLSIGLVASVLHLGQPLKAWRAFLGWRRSWLSREIIAFNAFAGAAAATLVLSLATSSAGWPELIRFLTPTTLAAAGIGLAAVFASAMVYVDTKRPFWCGRNTFGNFFGTALALGASVAAGVFSFGGSLTLTKAFAVAAVALQFTLFLWRELELHRAGQVATNPIHLNVRVIRELLPWTSRARIACFICALLFGWLTVENLAGLAPLWGSLVALAAVSGEIIWRYVFFAAGAGKRMPGAVAA